MGKCREIMKSCIFLEQQTSEFKSWDHIPPSQKSLQANNNIQILTKSWARVLCGCLIVYASCQLLPLRPPSLPCSFPNIHTCSHLELFHLLFPPGECPYIGCARSQLSWSQDQLKSQSPPTRTELLQITYFETALPAIPYPFTMNIFLNFIDH